jgi:hypothetical protein
VLRSSLREGTGATHSHGIDSPYSDRERGKRQTEKKGERERKKGPRREVGKTTSLLSCFF